MIDMIKIYYNLCCLKSCDMLNLLKFNGVELEVVFYLDMFVDVVIVWELLCMLGMFSVCELMCQKEDFYKMFYLVDSQLSEEVLIQVLVEYFKLMECFIVVVNGQVCIG